ncbi:facilitated trehalose transporter Tret1-like [Coccinella septempunctata]|uniref:facilitated trehalose transporter Tret1-like n=1 Tax=Coccinella septempunctata TaxID=41139 RepID=UPI001D085F4C|nr:facilitated trehalose transporter Tret1-like [Coccinella septempunctata]
MLFGILWSYIKIIWEKRSSRSSSELNADRKWDTTIYQIFISLGPLIFCFSVGAMMGFSGIFLPQLEAGKGQMKTNGDVQSWIASSAVLSMTFFSLFGGFLMEEVGRRSAHIIPAIPGIAGWLTIYFARNISTILIGRILTGISCGLFAPITSAYIGEITSPSLRPFILGCITLSVTSGTLLCHLVGTFYSWRTTAIFCAIFPTIGGILTFFSEETPTWLFRKDRIEDACAAFSRIRGQSEETEKELEVMLEKHKNGGFRSKPLAEITQDLIAKPELFKPLLVVVLYFVSAQFAGINVVTFYAIDVVKLSLGAKFEKSHVTMLGMDFIRVVTSVIACILLKNLKRRHLVVGGGVGCMGCLLTLSFSNFLSRVTENTLLSVYAPLTALLAYVFFISISLVPLPWCLAGELLPQELKGLASSLLCFFSFTAFFIAVKCAPFLFEFLGAGLTYLVFCGSVLFGTTLCWFFLPETKNKTLEEISDTYSER